MRDIVEFIKKEMATRGMTYDFLADRAGMSKQNLWMKLNKNTRPNFETVLKILTALDYEISIERKEDASGIDRTRKFFECAEEEQVGYDCIVKLLAATGYEIKIETHENELKVKKGIDNC